MINTKIDWADRTWNPITGCTNNCGYCYARKIATRFKGSKAFPNGFEPTFHSLRLMEPFGERYPKIIFVCSMGEFFSDDVPEQWRAQVFEHIDSITRAGRSHTYIFLTKQPQNMYKYKFPANCWIGVTATNATQYKNAIRGLAKTEAFVKYISFEPLLGYCNASADDFKTAGIDWIIIGAQTCPTIKPELEALRNIVSVARILNLPIFMKRNLLNARKREQPKMTELDFLNYYGVSFCQEYPWRLAKSGYYDLAYNRRTPRGLHLQ